MAIRLRSLALQVRLELLRVVTESQVAVVQRHVDVSVVSRVIALSAHLPQALHPGLLVGGTV